MRKTFCLLLTALFTLVAQTALGAGTPDASARDLLERAGIRGRGVVLVLGAKDCDLVAELARNSAVFFRVPDNDSATVAKCREEGAWTRPGPTSAAWTRRPAIFRRGRTSRSGDSWPRAARAVPDGLLVDRDGRIIVVLRDGRVLCLGGE